MAITYIQLYQRSLKECDAVLTTSAYALEAESLEGLRSWFSEWKKDLYVIGPLLPSEYGRVAADSAPGFPETREFLDKALAEHGERSVMLVSSGFYQ